jgi:hypothetical protein
LCAPESAIAGVGNETQYEKQIDLTERGQQIATGASASALAFGQFSL